MKHIYMVMLVLVSLIIVLMPTTPVDAKDTSGSRSIDHEEIQNLGYIWHSKDTERTTYHNSSGAYVNYMTLINYGNPNIFWHPFNHTNGIPLNIFGVNVSLMLDGAGIVRFMMSEMPGQSPFYTKDVLLPKTNNAFQQFQVEFRTNVTARGDIYIGFMIPTLSYEYSVRMELVTGDGSPVGWYDESGGIANYHSNYEWNMSVIEYEMGYNSVYIHDYYPTPIETGFDYIEMANMSFLANIPYGTSVTLDFYHGTVLNWTFTLTTSDDCVIQLHRLNITNIRVTLHTSFLACPEIQNIYVIYYHNDYPKITLTQTEKTIQRNSNFDLWDYLEGYDSDGDELQWTISNEQPDTSVPINYEINISLSDGYGGVDGAQFILRIQNSAPVIDELRIRFNDTNGQDIDITTRAVEDGQFVEYIAPLFNSTVSLSQDVTCHDADGDNIGITVVNSINSNVISLNSTFIHYNVSVDDGYLFTYMDFYLAVIIPQSYLYHYTYIQVQNQTVEVPIYVNNTVTILREVPVYHNRTINRTVNQTVYCNDTITVHDKVEITKSFDEYMGDWAASKQGSSILAMSLILSITFLTVYMLFARTHDNMSFKEWVQMIRSRSELITAQETVSQDVPDETISTDNSVLEADDIIDEDGNPILQEEAPVEEIERSDEVAD